MVACGVCGQTPSKDFFLGGCPSSVGNTLFVIHRTAESISGYTFPLYKTSEPIRSSFYSVFQVNLDHDILTKPLPIYRYDGFLNLKDGYGLEARYRIRHYRFFFVFLSVFHARLLVFLLLITPFFQ